MAARPDGITREFLLSQGWILVEEKPLFERFEHSNSPSTLKAHIGMYGDFSITELHWCNETPERYFNTVNSNLNQADYFTIINLLRIPALSDMP